MSPIYKLSLPSPDSADLPLFQISKPNPNATHWSMFYFAYAGHLIPPKRIEFGKIQKNPATSGGGTRISITGKTPEEKAVWQTLGEGNEDCVEWVVLCAALNLLECVRFPSRRVPEPNSTAIVTKFSKLQRRMVLLLVVRHQPLLLPRRMLVAVALQCLPEAAPFRQIYGLEAQAPLLLSNGCSGRRPTSHSLRQVDEGFRQMVWVARPLVWAALLRAWVVRRRQEWAVRHLQEWVVRYLQEWVVHCHQEWAARHLQEWVVHCHQEWAVRRRQGWVVRRQLAWDVLLWTHECNKTQEAYRWDHRWASRILDLVTHMGRRVKGHRNPAMAAVVICPKSTRYSSPVECRDNSKGVGSRH